MYNAVLLNMDLPYNCVLSIIPEQDGAIRKWTTAIWKIVTKGSLKLRKLLSWNGRCFNCRYVVLKMRSPTSICDFKTSQVIFHKSGGMGKWYRKGVMKEEGGRQERSGGGRRGKEWREWLAEWKESGKDRWRGVRTETDSLVFRPD